jgi:hypothetical protein
MNTLDYLTSRVIAVAGSLTISAVLFAAAIAPATQNIATSGAFA